MIRALETDAQGEIMALLEQCSLPVSDLGAASPFFLGASDAGGLTGVVGVEQHGRVGLLRSLAVRQDMRAAGLGTQLADAAERWAAANGIEVLYLLTTTAEKFFARRGYQAQARDQVNPIIQQTTEFTDACPASATVMMRALQA